MIHPPAGTLVIHPPAGTLVIHPPAGTLVIHPPAGTLVMHPPAGTLVIHPPTCTLAMQCVSRCHHTEADGREDVGASSYAASVVDGAGPDDRGEGGDGPSCPPAAVCHHQGPHPGGQGHRQAAHHGQGQGEDLAHRFNPLTAKYLNLYLVPGAQYLNTVKRENLAEIHFH